MSRVQWGIRIIVQCAAAGTCPPWQSLSIVERAKAWGPAAMWWTVAKEAAANWSGHKDARQGAALTYYSVFSLGPIIVIAIAIAGLFFGHEAVTSQVTSSLKGMLGETGAKAIESMLAASRPAEGAGDDPRHRRPAVRGDRRGRAVEGRARRRLGGGGIGGRGVAFRSQLRAVVRSGPRPRVSSPRLAAGDGCGSGRGGAQVRRCRTPCPRAFCTSSAWWSRFAVVTVLFAMIFKWLPDVFVGWRDVWLGRS